MSRALRTALLLVFVPLWASGCVWLLLHLAFQQQGPFGPLPNPAEVQWLRVHGVVAVAAVFLLGCVATAHINERWRSGRSRGSGLTLAGSALLLVLSGYALYYTTAGLHDGAARVHEVLGAAAVLPAVIHWLRRRSVAPRLPRHGHPAPGGHAHSHRFTGGSGPQPHR
ncbi:MAG: hypothetical protein JSR67_10715 [Proteobacteria bacterium]|nr:hypothetical protein [Pseudomonadota bacterium]